MYDDLTVRYKMMLFSANSAHQPNIFNFDMILYVDIQTFELRYKMIERNKSEIKFRDISKEGYDKWHIPQEIDEFYYNKLREKGINGKIIFWELTKKNLLYC